MLQSSLTKYKQSKSWFLSCINVLIILCNSCIVITNETKKDFATAVQRYPDFTPLTIDTLREILIKDTTHYKTVVVYSPGCGECTECLSNDCRLFLNNADTSKYRFYFIHEHSGKLNYAKDYLLRTLGTQVVNYYFHDNAPRYCAYGQNANTNRITHIAEDVYDVKLTAAVNNALPQVWVSDKKNRLKLAYIPPQEGIDEVFIGLQPAYIIGKEHDFDNIDFTKTDTLIYQ